MSILANRQRFGKNRVEGLDSGADDYLTKPFSKANYLQEYELWEEDKRNICK